MSPLPPLISSPEPASSSTVTRPHRLVKPLGRARDFEIERGRRAASVRGRKRRRHARTLALALGLPLGVLALWMGARLTATSLASWPSGEEVASGVRIARAPVFAGTNWFFASSEGCVWRTSRTGNAPQKVWAGAFPGAPQVVAMTDGVVVAGGDGTLVHLDAGGKTNWTASLGISLSSRPALVPNNGRPLLVGADDGGHLWARDAQTGAALWRQNAGAPVGEGVSVTPWGIVAPLLGSATARGGLRCFSASSGQPVWKFPQSARDRASGTATPRFDSRTNRLFWCNDEGAVFALDARTGRKIWKTLVAPRAGARSAVVLRASPVLVGDVLLVGGNDGGLRAFDARDGHALWTRWLGQPLSSPLGKARFNDRVVVVAGEKPVVLVDAERGQVAKTLGSGGVAWNGREFGAGDEAGVWHFWNS